MLYLIFAGKSKLVQSSPDAVGRHASPVELLVLGTFRVLGRAWTFDDCYEATFVSAEVHRLFLSICVKVCSGNISDCLYYS